ncbi:methyltransferase [Bacillus sp. CLL-7-23]|uniref:Methyltransferase n=1 Tax=Bacillus changyiensis TaxID=3004103 RepID=A0ABT4X5B3_9BACI|nr:methyltransferase [Bacillus changyiensis]MDA7027297.1 methyltransferase [Bacillus changyiensis]
MFYHQKQIDQLLENIEEEPEGKSNEKIGISFIPVFYISFLLSLFMLFIEYKYFLLVLYAPTVIFTLINPPLFEKKVYRLFACVYLIILVVVTHFWLQV